MFLVVHLTFTQNKHVKFTSVFAGWSNKLLSDGAHLIESDLMGHKDGCMTLVPKSVKS